MIIDLVEWLFDNVRMEKPRIISGGLLKLRQQLRRDPDAHQQLQHQRIRMVQTLSVNSVPTLLFRVKSLNNRKLKKYILTYENNLRRLFGRDGISKDMNGMYAKHNNELRMQLSGMDFLI